VSLIALFVVAIAICLLVHFSYKYLVRLKRDEEARFRLAISRIGFEEAKLKAYQVVPGWSHMVRTGGVTSVSPLPSDLADFFGKYSRVESPMGDVFELNGVRDGFVDVGRTFDQAIFYIRIRDGALFEFDGEENALPVGEPDYPSMFHWIALRSD
jgi:hypothetical protein